MEYAALAKHFERLEATTKRLERTQIIADILGEVGADEIEATVRLMQGKVRPDWEGIELGLAEKMILRALADASGHTDVVSIYHDAGDLGEAAKRLLEGASSQQSTLFGPEPLSVQSAYDRLLEIARVEGAGSQDMKQKLLRKLLADAGPADAKFLIRTVAGRLRLGVADMTVLEALAAWQVGRGVRSVQEMDPDERAEHETVRAELERAFDVSSDLARVADVLAHTGLAGVGLLGVEHGVPLRPMAAERLKTVSEILEKHDHRSAVEYKYDGLRLQCHVRAASASAPADVRLFSRRLEELTDQFPDVQQALLAAFTGHSCIVEGEVVAVDADGRMRPFQEISRRRGRKRGLGENRISNELRLAEEDEPRVAAERTKGGSTTAAMKDARLTVRPEDEVAVAIYLFDCVAADGDSTMHEPYLERRARLATLFSFNDRVQESTMAECPDEAAVEAFFQQAVQDGAEGIMCKHPEGVYKAGNRGFDWIKYKTDYTEELVDTMDLVAVGAFYGRGRRAGWYGALLMACRNESTGKFESVCKLGTGFDDETLKGLKEHFAPHVRAERPAEVISEMVPDVWFGPAVVIEVQAAEITLSPIHRAAWDVHRKDSGLAARFPRFARWRDDKGPEQATTTAELERIYLEQGKR